MDDTRNQGPEKQSPTIFEPKSPTALTSVLDLIEHKRPEPEDEILSGFLRRKQICFLSGGSKTHKSFICAQIAVALALGVPVMGLAPPTSYRVCLVNFELDKPTQSERIEAILYRTLGFRGDPPYDMAVCETELDQRNRMDFLNEIAKTELNKNLLLLNLRGEKFTEASLIGYLDSALSMSENGAVIEGSSCVDLIIFDPGYCLWGTDLDENALEQVVAFCQRMQAFAEKKEAALLVTHHHSKSGGSGYRSFDKMSGSGGFGRAMDAAIVVDMINKEKPEDGYTVDMTARSAPAPGRVYCRFEWPVMVRDDNLAEAVGADVKPAPKRRNRPKTSKYLECVEHLAEKGWLSGKPELIAAMEREFKVSKPTGYRYAAKMVSEGRIEEKDGLIRIASTSVPD